VDSAVQVKYPKALLLSDFFGPMHDTGGALFAYLLSDPWPLLMERAHLTV
jgi:hypothetical protein